MYYSTNYQYVPDAVSRKSVIYSRAYNLHAYGGKQASKHREDPSGIWKF